MWYESDASVPQIHASESPGKLIEKQKPRLDEVGYGLGLCFFTTPNYEDHWCTTNSPDICGVPAACYVHTYYLI